MNAVFRSDIISIMIPCYNCEKFLPTCLEALLRQTWPLEKMELVLVNDGSSDSTWEIIKTYESVFRAGGADFLKISQENSGVGAAVNSALKYISGEFFMWQDSDDWYEPDALEKLHSYLKKHKDTGFVRGEVNFRSEDAPEKVLRVGQNFQLLLPFAAAGPCGYLQEVVFNCLTRSNSLSHSKRSILQSILHKQEYLRILYHSFQNIKCSPGTKKELLALADRRFKKKIRHDKFKLLLRWIFFKEKQLKFVELMKLIFNTVE